MDAREEEERNALKMVASGMSLADVGERMGWGHSCTKLLRRRLLLAASREMHPANPEGDPLLARAAMGRLIT